MLAAVLGIPNRTYGGGRYAGTSGDLPICESLTEQGDHIAAFISVGSVGVSRMDIGSWMLRGMILVSILYSS